MTTTRENFIETLLHPLNKWKCDGSKLKLQKGKWRVRFHDDNSIDVYKLIKNNTMLPYYCDNDFTKIVNFIQEEIGFNPLPEETIEEWFAKQETYGMRIISYDRYISLHDNIGEVWAYIPNEWDTERKKSTILQLLQIYKG